MNRLAALIKFALKLSICVFIGMPLMLGMTAMGLACGYAADLIERIRDGRAAATLRV